MLELECRHYNLHLNEVTESQMAKIKRCEEPFSDGSSSLRFLLLIIYLQWEV